ncbi:MAG: hypothetical protein ACFFG0_06335 [Candidatus Thorarchaeota archaeon]
MTETDKQIKKVWNTLKDSQKRDALDKAHIYSNINLNNISLETIKIALRAVGIRVY